ncbi:MAG: flagellar motor stator protein MotA [Firmicutes bacterium]|nr:flagellar motor stator protein MotA [Bacillota bacterium]
MFVIIGLIIVFGAVIGGFVIEGGKIKLLIQPIELMIIGGAALGSLLVSAPPSLLMKVFKKVLSSFIPSKKGFSKKFYLNMLMMLNELYSVANANGIIALEKHVEEPKESEIFNRYPDLVKHSKVMSFITDSFRLMIMGSISSHDLENIMEADAEIQHSEGAKPAALLQKIGDALPGLGIVAAVLGIVITMQAIGGPAEEIGHKVAVALVGTFLGILLSYGMVQPLATNIELEHEEELKAYDVLKSGITAYAAGMHPLFALEFARRSIPDSVRPSFKEMEEAIKGPKE